MTYFNFRKLIEKYTRDFTLLSENKGKYDDAGDYVKGSITQTVLRGAIIGFAENKIYRSEGTLTQQDMSLHMTQPIDNALMGATVIFEGNKYRLEAQKRKNNAVFTGVYSYTLKYVSAFKEGAE